MMNQKRFEGQRFVMLALGVAVLSLLVACGIASAKKAFWYDELVSYYLTIDASPAHMVQAIANNVDTAPPFYHLVGWSWIRLFGENAFALRLFSSAGIALTLVLVWATLRRVYNGWIALIAGVLIFSISDLILVQNAEARFYGLFLSLCAAAVLIYQRLGDQAPAPRWLLLLNTLVHAALVLTHYVGVLYSGVILLAFMVRDLTRGQRHLTYYASIVVGWGIFLLWLTSFINQFSMVRQYSWIPRPNLVLLAFIYIGGISLHILLCVIAFGLASARLRRAYPVASSPARTSLRIVGICFVLVPLFTWILSQFATSLFLPRYMLPTAIGWAILLADLSAPTMTALLKLKDKSRTIRGVLGVGLMLLLAIPILTALRQPVDAIPGTGDRQFGYADLPIVTTSPHQFLPRYYYANVPRPRYYFVLDWESALDQRSVNTATTSFKLMEAFKNAYPQVGQNILSFSDFLSRYDRFLVLNDGANAWPEIRLKETSGYNWTPLGDVGGTSLILVAKK